MFDEMNQAGCYASAANTDVAKLVSSGEETMSKHILPKSGLEGLSACLAYCEPNFLLQTGAWSIPYEHAAKTARLNI